jgi:hypothetical protein
MEMAGVRLEAGNYDEEIKATSLTWKGSINFDRVGGYICTRGFTRESLKKRSEGNGGANISESGLSVQRPLPDERRRKSVKETGVLVKEKVHFPSGTNSAWILGSMADPVSSLRVKEGYQSPQA